VTAARLVSALSCLLMMGGAFMFYRLSDLTLQDLGTKLGSVLGGGIMGIYILGFMTTRGTQRSVAYGVAAAVVFSIYMAIIDFWKITPEQISSALGVSQYVALWMVKPVHIYYVGLAGNLLAFLVAYFVASMFEPKRDLPGLTFWTEMNAAEEEA
jgi:SSS family solute:Na+ symporter